MCHVTGSVRAVPPLRGRAGGSAMILMVSLRKNVKFLQRSTGRPIAPIPAMSVGGVHRSQLLNNVCQGPNSKMGSSRKFSKSFWRRPGKFRAPFDTEISTFWRNFCAYSSSAKISISIWFLTHQRVKPLGSRVKTVDWLIGSKVKIVDWYHYFKG